MVEEGGRHHHLLQRKGYLPPTRNGQGKVDLGLPNSFNIAFSRQEECRDWEIYSSIVHGPHKLLRFFADDRINIEAAYKRL